MLSKFDKMKGNIRFALVICVVIKLAAALLSLILTVLFSFSEISDILIDSYFSLIFIKAEYAGPIGFWVLLISEILGWPAGIALTVNIEEKVWIPSLVFSVLSLIDFCSCIVTIIMSTDSFQPMTYLGAIFNAIILCLAVLYPIAHRKAHRQPTSDPSTA